VPRNDLQCVTSRGLCTETRKCSICLWGRECFLFSRRSIPAKDTPRLMQSVSGYLSRYQSSRDMKQIIDYHLVLRLRTRGAMPPFTHTSSWRVQERLYLFMKKEWSSSFLYISTICAPARSSNRERESSTDSSSVTFSVFLHRDYIYRLVVAC
jgi:hypothetical protein